MYSLRLTGGGEEGASGSGQWDFSSFGVSLDVQGAYDVASWREASDDGDV